MSAAEDRIPPGLAGIIVGLMIAVVLVAAGGCADSHALDCAEREPTCEVEFAEIDVACFAAGTANRMAWQRHEELGCTSCLAPLYADDIASREPIDGLAAWDEYRRLLDAERCEDLVEVVSPW